MLTASSLVIVPSLNYITTGVQTGQMYEEKLEGLYAAEAGVEEGLWRMLTDKPSSFPDTSQITGINGMTVDVTIDAVTTVAGKEIGAGGVHDEYLDIVKSVTYEDGIYTWSLTTTNSGTGNVKIEMILIDLPPNVDYVPGSTGGDLYSGDPVVVGDSSTGIIVYWEFIPPYPTVPEGATREHFFQLSGPPGVAGVEGHGCIRATRQDVGTVWDVDSRPYSITAVASDADGDVVTTMKVGLWEGGQVSISGWLVNP
jgi:hypothetical protein